MTLSVLQVVFERVALDDGDCSSGHAMPLRLSPYGESFTGNWDREWGRVAPENRLWVTAVGLKACPASSSADRKACPGARLMAQPQFQTGE